MVELTLIVDCCPLQEISEDLTGDKATQGDGSVADCAGELIPWTEGNGDAGFDDWKVEELWIVLEDGNIPDGDKLVDETEVTAWFPWPTDISAEETEERRDGKNVSQFMYPMLHKLRKAKRRNSARGAWPLQGTTRDIRIDSVTERNWSWSWRKCHGHQHVKLNVNGSHIQQRL